MGRGYSGVRCVSSDDGIGHVAEDVAARQRGYGHRQHRGGRQYDADAARQCLPVCLFGADGLYDGLAHADHDELPAQPAKAGDTA